MKELTDNNIAFIDGQNLHLGTTNAVEPWIVDLERFRVYLTQKYNVNRAYYYVGFTYTDGRNDRLYKSIQEAGFILYFKPHGELFASKKKGNVDADIIFDVMEKMYKEQDAFDKIILVSGDGDYFKMVEFLIAEDKFKKILFPTQKGASSLYRLIPLSHRMNLSDNGVKKKVSKNVKEKASLGN